MTATRSASVATTARLPFEYLAEGVRSPQLALERGSLKLVREYGEADLLYDIARDPGERTSLAADPAYAEEMVSLNLALSARWDLARLDADVRASQARRRLVARALATGRLSRWDHPTLDLAGPYIRTGQDFWQTLEAARVPD